MIKNIKYLLLILFISKTYASTGELDLTFNPDSNDSVSAILPQTDGSILLGGAFDTISGVFSARAARLAANSLLDENFNAPIPVDGTITAMAAQTDGKIIVAGTFTIVGNITRNHIARFNADGSLDTSFDPNVTGTIIDALALQMVDGEQRILIGGQFNAIGDSSEPRNNIARLHPDGSLDNSFSTSVDNRVRSIVFTNDNRILIGGDFSNIGSIAIDRIARLSAAGLFDAGFSSPFIEPISNSNLVFSIAVQANDQIVIGGTFLNIGDASRNRVARLNDNGNLDTNFVTPSISGDGVVNSVLVQPDGRVLLGGRFNNVDDVPMTANLARLNTDGSLDTGFTPNLEPSASVLVVAQQPSNGGILIGGTFTSVNGITRNRIARLDNPVSEFNLATTTLTQTEGNTDQSIYQFEVSRTIAINSVASLDYTISGGDNNPATADDFVSNELAQGTLTFTDGVPRQTISVAVRSDTLTELDETFTVTLSNPVNAVLPSTVVAQGTILNDDIAVDAGFNPTADNSVFSILTQADGSILVGGTFANVAISNGARNRVARFNPDDSLDGMFNPPSNSVNGSVFAMLVQGDGKIVLAGSFTTFGGSTRNAIARIHADGSFDEDFNPDVTGSTIDALALQMIDGEEKILIGGNFSAVGDVSRNNMARLNLDGSLDDSFDPNVDNRVRSIVVDNQNRILLSGSFNNVGNTTNTTTRHITRLNADGSLDDNFNSPFTSAMDGNNTIFSIAIQADERILIGGNFTSIGGVPRRAVARLNADGSLDASFIPADIPSNGTVYAVVIQTDNQILIGGSFNDVGGVAMTANLARLNTDGSLDITFAPNVNDTVFTIAQQATSGDILIGGLFLQVDGMTRDRIASIENPVSTLDFNTTLLSEVEGNSGEIIYQFEVLRTIVFSGVASVDYSVSGDGDNPANADDFTNSELAQDTLTFDDGQTSQTISITVRGDTRIEDDETFIVTLSNPSNAILSTNVAQGIIVNDDSEICLPITASNGGIAVVCL